jgi:hypothetical protein
MRAAGATRRSLRLSSRLTCIGDYCGLRNGASRKRPNAWPKINKFAAGFCSFPRQHSLCTVERMNVAVLLTSPATRARSGDVAPRGAELHPALRRAFFKTPLCARNSGWRLLTWLKHGWVVWGATTSAYVDAQCRRSDTLTDSRRR